MTLVYCRDCGIYEEKSDVAAFLATHWQAYSHDAGEVPSPERQRNEDAE